MRSWNDVPSLEPAMPACVGRSLRLTEVGVQNLEELTAHLCRLDPDDRRLRFMRTVTDHDISALVAASSADAIRLGLIDATGALLSVVEAFPYDVGLRTDMELAFSTDSEWRRRGLASFLFHAIARVAVNRGVTRLILQCDSRNVPMRRLFHRVGAEARDELGEVSAIWECDRTGPRAPSRSVA